MSQARIAAHAADDRPAPDADVLAAVRDVYERGRTIEALARAERFAPLHRWTGVEGCILAARIAANTGAPGLATRLSFRAWRQAPHRADAVAQLGYEVLFRRGPLALWQRLRGRADDPDDDPEHAAELAALKARAAASLRDFSLAETLLGRAESLDPNRPWVRLQRAFLLEQQDRVEEALETARSACTLHLYPYYRPGVQTCAHLEQLLDRDDEAIALLEEAARVLESGPVCQQLYALLSENGRWTEAEAALERYAALSPLLEPRLERWLNAQRALTAYRLGRRSDAARFAARLDDELHARFAARLSAPPPARERVQLDVTFVRQHFKTCAPATLASLGRFFDLPAEHLKLAEAVCYDGTPIWHQRDWAEKNGWSVREFRVTHESAVALLEAGIPFALSTVDATSAHMMAVTGFDRARGTLLLRDPSQPYVVEADAEQLLRRYAAERPHGIVFIPAEHRSKLDGLELPDAPLYDAHHELTMALARHDRSAAAASLERMEAADADGRLTWEARLALAVYDANLAEQARCLDKLLEKAPNAPARLLHRFACLRDAPRDERLGFLAAACARDGSDPALLIAHARALGGDARELDDARRLLKRAMRFRPVDPDAIEALANLHWEQGDTDQATECYRFAAGLDGFREHRYRAWFVACRRTRRTSEALAHLKDRFARFGARSEQPALTLAWAFNQMEQPARAREVLEHARRLRPDDGPLAIGAARLLATLGELEGAEALLAEAEGRVHENDRLRARLEIAERRLDYEAMLDVGRRLLATEPLALDAHGAVARALAKRAGTAAAIAALGEACEAFPRHYGLHRMLVEWSREEGPEAVEQATRALLAIEPADAWARRELALTLLQAKRDDEALEQAIEAARIEPSGSYSYSVLALVHRHAGRTDEARAQLRRAIELSVDNGAAISSLLELARNDEERKADLAFVETELVRQVVSGDGLLAYVDHARPVLGPDALLAVLRQAHAERPDLWHAWSALVAQLAHMLLLDDALDVAKESCGRFAHLPRTWLDLALVHRYRNENDAEIEAARRSFEMNPSWSPATLALTSALERRGRMEEALTIYERALQHEANDAELHVHHARLSWRLRRGADAFAALERALRLAPSYGFAWDLLRDWSAQSGEPERPRRLALTLAEERPGDEAIWLALARVTTPIADALPYAERAVALNPRSVEAWDLQAEIAALAERFDDAARACEEGAAACSGGAHVLHGRRAWIEARRGRKSEAIRLMRAVLADNQSYLWGWYQLASWLLDEGRAADAAMAYEQLLRLQPHDGWAHRQLAFLRLEQGDRSAARAAFAAALALEPTDVAAAHNLLDLELAAADVDSAEATLAVMQTHQPGAPTCAAEVRVRLKQRRKRAALQALATLTDAPDPDPWPIDAAVQAFRSAGLDGAALSLLSRRLRRPNANPQVAAAVVRLLAERGSALRAVLKFMRLRDDEQRRRAALPLLQALANARRTLLLLWLLQRRGAVFRADDAVWGQVGYALTTVGRMKQAVAWLADWRERAHADPWMMFNYCFALRELGRYGEATDVARHVVETLAHREGADDMRLFLAVEDALAGRVSSARVHLEASKARADVAYDRQMKALAEALVAFQELPQPERRRGFAAVRPRLDAQFGDLWLFRAPPDLRRTFRRAGDVFVRGGGGPAAWAWFKWHLHWQWLLLLPVLALGAAALV